MVKEGLKIVVSSAEDPSEVKQAIRNCIWEKCSAVKKRKNAQTQRFPRAGNVLVLPGIDYCSKVWGCMRKSQCGRLQRW